MHASSKETVKLTDDVDGGDEPVGVQQNVRELEVAPEFNSEDMEPPDGVFDNEPN